MTSFKPLQVLILAGILGAATACSVAQSGPMAGSPGGPAMGEPMRQHDPASMQARMAAQMAARLAEVKARHKITPPQEAAWASYAAAMQPPARPAMAASNGLVYRPRIADAELRACLGAAGSEL